MTHWHPDTRNERVRLVFESARVITDAEEQQILHAPPAVATVCPPVIFGIMSRWQQEPEKFFSDVYMMVNFREIIIHMPDNVVWFRRSANGIDIVLRNKTIYAYRIELAATQEVEALLAAVMKTSFISGLASRWARVGAIAMP